MKTLGIIIGILMIGLGIYAMGVPFRTFLGIGWLLGAMLLIHGIEMAIRAFSQKKKEMWQGVLGILVAIGGVLLLCNGVNRFLTDVAVAYLIGATVIAYGIMETVDGAKNVKTVKGLSILKILCGVFSVIAGVFAMMHPIMTMFSIGFLIAFSIVFQGIDMILISIAMGKKKAE